MYQYLSNCENWIYRLLDNFTEVEVVIASKQFLDNPFYSEKFRYIRFPLQDPGTETNEIKKKIFSFVTSLGYKWYLCHAVKKLRVDLMHSHFAPVGWEYHRQAKNLGVPHIISFYGFDYENLPALHPEWNNRYKLLFGEADAFICEGTFAASVLHSQGCPEKKIFVSHLGVDCARIPCFPRKKNPGELRLLQVAILTPKKGHIYTIRSFIHALETCPDMTLTIVGPDREGIKKDLLDEIRNDPVREKIIFIDSIDFNQLYDFMKDYHVFIHPSIHTEHHDSEGGAPVVLLDAQATGMPVISTRHCDIPDEVLDQKTGVLVPEKDVPALSNAIRFFYEMDTERYQEFATEARNHVEKEYDIRKCTETLQKIYRTVINEKRSLV
jgi:colanic acid/amylovoran biosynthesis glycosyltransferase